MFLYNPYIIGLYYLHETQSSSTSRDTNWINTALNGISGLYIFAFNFTLTMAVQIKEQDIWKIHIAYTIANMQTTFINILSYPIKSYSEN